MVIKTFEYFISYWKFTWKHNCRPLPGEISPKYYKQINCSINVLYSSMPEEVESNKILRKIRAVVLGYGPSWIFKQALLDTIRPW